MFDRLGLVSLAPCCPNLCIKGGITLLAEQCTKAYNKKRSKGVRCDQGHMRVPTDITLREMVTWQGVKQQNNPPHKNINLTGVSASSRWVAHARGKFDGSM